MQVQICHEWKIMENMIRLEDGSWENSGDFESFRCYYCLGKFSTFEAREVHEDSHAKTDKSAQMDGGWK